MSSQRYISVRFEPWACGHARHGGEGRRDQLCPACRNQARRYRAHWSALSLAFVLALLVLCAVAGAR
jgi:hypothetical protein